MQAKVGPSRIFAGSKSREDFLPGRVHRRVRFDLNVEMKVSCRRPCCVPETDHESIAHAVVIEPCGERHAVDRRAPDVEPARYRYSPEIRHAARTNYLKLHRREMCCEEEIEESSLGITGWAFTEIRDWSSVDIGESMTI